MHCLVVGMSHIECLRRGWDLVEARNGHRVEFLNLREFLNERAEGAHPEVRREGSRYIRREEMAARFAEMAQGTDVVVFCLQGNQHNIIGMVEIESMANASEAVLGGVDRGLRSWLTLFLPHCPAETRLLYAPPPIQSETHIRERAGRFRQQLARAPIRNAGDRLTLWELQCRATQRVAEEYGISVIPLPLSVRSASGFLAEDCYGGDATHASSVYGARVMEQVFANLRDGREASGHPYAALPPYAYWRSAMGIAPGNIDPVVAPRFLLGSEDKVATAGSCFAQHISRRLRFAGFHFLEVENAREDDSAEGIDTYDFSARYGNIYTSRQLLQLFDRAFGYYKPLEHAWERPDGRFCDPFRPRISPAGFDSPLAVEAERQQHLAAVRRMFRELDVLVFTLGLTECWVSRLDGAVFPVAPGVAGGRYDPSRHAFLNLGVAQVRADMELFLAKLRQVNPGARVLLTVSPVALAATWVQRHVLVSTVHSKSILRAAAGEIVEAHGHVEYFPSYEIITGPHAGADYFTPDRRGVTEVGVDHVMHVFMSRMTTAGTNRDPGPPTARTNPYAEMERASEAACDEELYARDAPN